MIFEHIMQILEKKKKKSNKIKNIATLKAITLKRGSSL